jgi:hypothetical protein
MAIPALEDLIRPRGEFTEGAFIERPTQEMRWSSPRRARCFHPRPSRRLPRLGGGELTRLSAQHFPVAVLDSQTRSLRVVRLAGEPPAEGDRRLLDTPLLR